MHTEAPAANEYITLTDDKTVSVRQVYHHQSKLFPVKEKEKKKDFFCCLNFIFLNKDRRIIYIYLSNVCFFVIRL